MTYPPTNRSFQPDPWEPVPDRRDPNELVGMLAGLMVLGIAFFVVWVILP